jgi:hypothetical protein
MEIVLRATRGSTGLKIAISELTAVFNSDRIDSNRGNTSKGIRRGTSAGLVRVQLI